MIELHLIGYTEDGDHLVLDLDADGEGRYTLVVDPDLLATLEAVRDERLAAGKPVDAREEPPTPVRAGHQDTEPGPSAVRDDPVGPARAEPGDNGRAPDDEVAWAPAPREELVRLVAPPSDAGVPGDDPGVEPPSDDAEPGSQPGATSQVRSHLSPAEIQARLRAGRSVRAVAKEAGVDREWVERWNDPIRAERERVLADARSRRVDHPMARPLGAVVDRSLSERGVPPSEASWRVVRRDDGRWRVSVRFEERGRPRTATWLLDPDAERLRAQSQLAAELSAPGRRTSRR